jgi:hypothetical protein
MSKPSPIAFKVAVAKAIGEHARLGFPIYIWRNGRVVELSPEEVLSLNRNKDQVDH